MPSTAASNVPLRTAASRRPGVGQVARGQKHRAPRLLVIAVAVDVGLREREGRYEAGPDGRHVGRRPDHAEQRLVHLAMGDEVKGRRLAFDRRFERRRRIIGHGRALTRAVAVDAATGGDETGFDRRAGVLTLELAELPLPGKEPERVARLGAERALEIDIARAAFEPVPALDLGLEERLLEHEVGEDGVFERHGCLSAGLHGELEGVGDEFRRQVHPPRRELDECRRQGVEVVGADKLVGLDGPDLCAVEGLLDDGDEVRPLPRPVEGRRDGEEQRLGRGGVGAVEMEGKPGRLRNRRERSRSSRRASGRREGSAIGCVAPRPFVLAFMIVRSSGRVMRPTC